MEHINSTASRQLNPRENMRALEKAALEQDIRVALRKNVTVRARLLLGISFALPFSVYFMYHLAAPAGVMQNHHAASGAYMNFMQTFMYRQKSMTEIYRPEIHLKEQASSLNDYTRRIAKERKEGTLREGVHHPSSWL